jgi:Ca2+-binding EF-hand superfamily protein
VRTAADAARARAHGAAPVPLRTRKLPKSSERARTDMAYEPRPPSSRSARSASSRNNLVLRQQHEQMKSQILKDMQMTSKKGGRHMDASAFKEMQAVASEEAARVMGAGAGAVPAMPKELLARARQSQRQPEVPSPSPFSAAEDTAASLQPVAAAATASPRAAATRGVRVDVAGKGIPLTTLIVDKLGQRGGQQRPGGVPQQLRKAFKKVDSDKDGKITLQELQEILSTIHINVSEQSLQRQFLLWTGGEPLLEFNTFIQRILPEDFPTTFNPREKASVHDIASLARTDHKENEARYGGLISNLRDWEVAFRDKIMAKTRGGPLELRKAWVKFDVNRSGDVTVDEIIEVCASWNLYPSAEVKEQLRWKYCTDENRSTGIVRFYDFVKGVVAEDFKSSAEAIRKLKQNIETQRDQVREQFLLFDQDFSGDITLDELVVLLEKMRIPMTAPSVEAVFRMIDKDSSQKISFEEFATTMADLDKADIPGMGGKLVWEQEHDPDEPHGFRPASAGSILSHDGEKEAKPIKSGHVVVDVNAAGKFVVNTAVRRFNAQERPEQTVDAGKTGGTYEVDLMQLVRSKIYQKYGEKGMYSWLRRACLAGVSAVDRFEHLDTMTKHLEPLAHHQENALENLSLMQWRRMLKELGLQLTDDAFASCVRMISPDGSDLVPFGIFTDVMAGKSESHALGLPSERAPKGRLVAEPPMAMVPPRSLSPYGVLSHDPVALVRYKIGQLTATRYAANPLTVGARRRLRDQFGDLDPTMSGRCTRSQFLSVLSYYNIDLKDDDWVAFAAKYAGTIVMADGSISYKRFLTEVLNPSAADAGFYTPRAVGRVQRPAFNPRTARSLRTPTIKLGQDIPMVKLGWQPTRAH